MICRICGKEISENSNFCDNCGNPINPAAQPPIPEQKFINYEKRAITLGIIGIVISFIFSIVGCIVSGFGIYYGSKEYKFTGKTSGLILSIIGMICSVIATLIGFWLLDFILTTILSITATASAVGNSFYLINAILSTINDAAMKISNFLS